MRAWIVILTAAFVLGACSLQLPGGTVTDEPFFEGTYEE